MEGGFTLTDEAFDVKINTLLFNYLSKKLNKKNTKKAAVSILHPSVYKKKF